MTRSSGPLLAISLWTYPLTHLLLVATKRFTALSLISLHITCTQKPKTSCSSRASECILFLYDSQLTAGSTFLRLDYNIHTLILQLFSVYNFSHSTQTRTLSCAPHSDICIAKGFRPDHKMVKHREKRREREQV